MLKCEPSRWLWSPSQTAAAKVKSPEPVTFTRDHWSSLRGMLRIRSGGFPGGLVVKNLPANAGDTGSIPGLGRSHMPWSSKAHVPHLLKLTHVKPVSSTREAVAMRSPHATTREKPPLATTRESPHITMKTHHRQR